MEKAKAFLEAVAADENLTKACYEVKTREELIEFAAKHGHVLTDQDIHDIAKIGYACAKQQSGIPLSDEELELVSGGIFDPMLAIAIYFAGLAIATGTMAGFGVYGVADWVMKKS